MTVSNTDKKAPDDEFGGPLIAIDDLRISRGGPLSDEEIDDLVAFTYANRQRESSSAAARRQSTFEELRAQALRRNPFESDQEVDDFVAWVHAERQRNLV